MWVPKTNSCHVCVTPGAQGSRYSARHVRKPLGSGDTAAREAHTLTKLQLNGRISSCADDKTPNYTASTLEPIKEVEHLKSSPDGDPAPRQHGDLSMRLHASAKVVTKF